MPCDQIDNIAFFYVYIDILNKISYRAESRAGTLSSNALELHYRNCLSFSFIYLHLTV